MVDSQLPPHEANEALVLDESEDALLLPAIEDRQQLIAHLSTLVRQRGFPTWVNAPLLLPTERFFPDPWKGGEASVRRVCRRLLRYAGLPDQRVDIEIYEEQPGRRATPAGKPVLKGTAELQVWPRGRRDGAWRFGVEAVALRTPHFFVASMARAVAWQWLEHHGHMVDENPERQRLVDVATHYLGFGVLTTDAALRHGAENTGGFSAKRTKTRLGQLSPRAMSFLLGAQLEVRGLDKAEIKGVERHLQPNQVGFVRAAMRWIRAHPESLDRLDLPPAGEWPVPPALRHFTGPLDGDDASSDEDRLDVDRGIEGINEGKPVFRVVRNMTARFAKASMLIVSLGAVSGRTGGLDISMVHIMGVAGTLLVASLVFGQFFRESRCSEPKCANPLTEADTHCPLCKGQVMGIIDDPKKRLAAEEALERGEDEGATGQATATGTSAKDSDSPRADPAPTLDP